MEAVLGKYRHHNVAAREQNNRGGGLSAQWGAREGRGKLIQE